MKYFLTLTLLLLTCTVANSNDNPIRTFKAFSYCHGAPSCRVKSKGITATGERVRKGIIAVDKRVIKLGTYVMILEPKEYAGVYKASDTGGRHIRGNAIDLWLPSQAASIRFGVKRVKLIILDDIMRCV